MEEGEPHKEALNELYEPNAAPVSNVDKEEAVPVPKEDRPQEAPSEAAPDTAQLRDMLGKDLKERLEKQAKVNAKKKARKPGVLPQEQEQLYGVRIAFQKALSKISENDTRKVAMEELEQLIQNNRTQPALRIYLSSLGEDTKPYSTNGKESQAESLFHSLLSDCVISITIAYMLIVLFVSVSY